MIFLRKDEQGRCAEFDGEINAKIEMVLLADFIFGPLAVSMLFVCFLVEVLVLNSGTP
jgi:hypothetical protein